MAVHGPAAPPKAFAHEIASYTDDELDRYLEVCGRVVGVRDPENITLDLIQRLRDFVDRPRRIAQSHIVDLKQVAERLQDVPTSFDTDLPSRSSSASVATTEPIPPEEEQDLKCLQEETAAYDKLVEAGGHPPYPRCHLERFFWTPEGFLEDDRYRDIVLFWRSQNNGRIQLCEGNLLRWTRFRRVQRIIRRWSVSNESTLVRASYFDSWDDFIQHPASRNWSGSWGFHEYVENIRARLGKYGVNRPFSPEQDLVQQDRLTDWIEYLGYEYYFYDQSASYVKHAHEWHDTAWEKLVKSGILQPGETYEVICDVDTAFRFQAERQNAESELEDATRADIETQSRGTRSRLALAEELLRSIIARNDAVSTFLQTTKQYRSKKDESERHALLLRWIVQQLPAVGHHFPKIRADPTHAMNSPLVPPEDVHRERNVPEESSPQQTSLKRARRSSQDDESPSKRLKASPQESRAGTTTQPFGRLPTSATGAVEPGGGEGLASGPHRLRRSARIAERVSKTDALAQRTLSVVQSRARIQSPASRARRRRRRRK